MRVVEEEEAEALMASGVWFDSPTKAKDYKIKVEQDIKKEKAQKVADKNATQAPKRQLQESSNERK
jgi:hypothetical protein